MKYQYPECIIGAFCPLSALLWWKKDCPLSNAGNCHSSAFDES